MPDTIRRMVMAPQWLKRYVDGEQARVTQELRQLGAAVRNPEFAPDAQAVCDEMARRVRSNLEVIVGRLDEQGYRFHDNGDDQTPTQPLAGPSPDADEFVAWLEANIGPVPMVVSSWVRIVGDVWLVGTHPDWEASAGADPLVIEIEQNRYPNHDLFRDYLIEEFGQRGGDVSAAPFQLVVAPDALHKDNVSGGAPYGIVLPDGCADAQFVTTTEGSFISYLRHVFGHGGFSETSGDVLAQWTVQRSLTTGLKPI